MQADWWIRKGRLTNQSLQELQLDLDRIKDDLPYVRAGSIPMEVFNDRLHGLRGKCEELSRTLEEMKRAVKSAGPQASRYNKELKGFQEQFLLISKHLREYGLELRTEYERVKRTSSGRGSKTSSVAFSPTSPQQVQLQMVANDYSDETYQRQMEHDMARLTGDIQMVEEIFRMLHQNVHEQATLVDSIENQVEYTHVAVVEAQEQLVDAKKKKDAACRKKCICGAILGVIIIIVILIIVLSLVLK